MSKLIHAISARPHPPSPARPLWLNSTVVGCRQTAAFWFCARSNNAFASPIAWPPAFKTRVRLTGLVELIKEAFAIRNQLLSGSDDSIEAITGHLGMNKCRLTSLIRLSYLAPDIVRALLEGRQPIELTPTRLLRLSKDLPHDWSEQRHALDFAV
jgi:hypothetical protein